MAFWNKWLKPNEKDIKQYLEKAVNMETVIRSMITSLNGQPIFFADNTDNYIKEGYLTNGDIYSIIRQISRSCSVPSWKLYEVKNEKALRDYKSQKLSVSGNEVHGLYRLKSLKTKALEEVENPALMSFFNNPNPLQHWTEFYELSVTFRLLTGNRYWVGVAPENGVNKGKIQDAYVLPSQFTEIIAGRGFAQPIGAYRVNFNPTIQFDAEFVSHSKYPNPEYTTFGQNLYGMSPLRPGKKILVKSNDGYTASAALLQSVGMKGMIVNRGQGRIDMDALEDRIKRMYSGSDKIGSVAATNFNLDYLQMAMTAVDLALNEGQMLTLRQLCNIYNYPSELLNDKESNKFNSHKEAKKSAFVNAAVPELNLDRDDFNSDWFLGKYKKADRREYFIDYDIDNVPEMQEDLEKLWARLDSSWEITPKERRKMKGLDEITDPQLDVPWVPMGLMPINERLSTETPDQNELEEEIQKILKR